MKIGRAIVISGILGLLSYGVAYAWRQKTLLENNDFSPAGVSLKKLSLQQIIIQLNIKITNKADINFYLHSVNLKAYLDGKFISDVLLSQEVFVPARGTSMLPMTFQFDPSQLLQNIGSSNIMNINNMKLRIMGKASATSGKILFSSLPIDLEYSLNNLIKI